MAELSTADKVRIKRGLMRFWSKKRHQLLVSEPDLSAAVDATDAWIDANASSYNAALPETARTNLTLAQKTLLFCAVAAMRVSVEFVRTLLMVEVD